MAHAAKIADTTPLKEKENCRKWLEDAEELSKKADEQGSDIDFLDDKYDTRLRQGWLKHAFIISFYQLYRFTKIDQSNVDQVKGFYAKAVKEAVQLGGDTDTNGCIVGGMIGALVGVQNIDDHMLRTTLSYDCAKNGRIRPEFLSVQRHALKNIDKLIKARPLKELVVVQE